VARQNVIVLEILTRLSEITDDKTSKYGCTQPVIIQKRLKTLGGLTLSY
jgi:hypothetical protein